MGNAWVDGEILCLYVRIFTPHVELVDSFVALLVVGFGNIDSVPPASS